MLCEAGAQPAGTFRGSQLQVGSTIDPEVSYCIVD